MPAHRISSSVAVAREDGVVDLLMRHIYGTMVAVRESVDRNNQIGLNFHNGMQKQ